MKQRYALFAAFLIQSSFASAQAGGCTAPVSLFTSTSDNPATICQGDVIGFNASASYAAPGHSIEHWIWRVGADRDTMDIALAVFTFPVAGVFEVTLEVVDEAGCASGESAPFIVLVSGTPDFSQTLVPAVACEGDAITLQAVAEQPLMIRDAVTCTPPSNGTPLIDSPTATISLLEVTGQPDGALADLDDLGDICLEMEHSYVGDLVLTVACPNGQSVVLHQQGGGGTFLGDANDADGSSIVPGNCFQYCFGLSPEHGTFAASVDIATVPVSQGFALEPGRYTSIQPLTQLLGCPLNGTWTFSSSDQLGSDNGYLCGWCISFGEQPDSSFIAQGPVLGSSPDSSFWTGTGITNLSDQSGAAILDPVAGTQELTYTVVDSYGCEHQAAFPVEVGAVPQVEITENTELGLVCAQPAGAFSYQWSYQDQIVVGAAGACFTPPGPGAISVVVVTGEGCSGSATLLGTSVVLPGTDGAGWIVFPNPNNGTFNFAVDRTITQGVLRITDMTGRCVHQRSTGALHAGSILPLAVDIAPGPYLVEVVDQGDVRLQQRIVVK